MPHPHWDARGLRWAAGAEAKGHVEAEAEAQAKAEAQAEAEAEAKALAEAEAEAEGNADADADAAGGRLHGTELGATDWWADASADSRAGVTGCNPNAPAAGRGPEEADGKPNSVEWEPASTAPRTPGSEAGRALCPSRLCVSAPCQGPTRASGLCKEGPCPSEPCAEP